MLLFAEVRLRRATERLFLCGLVPYRSFCEAVRFLVFVKWFQAHSHFSKSSRPGVLLIRARSSRLASSQNLDERLALVRRSVFDNLFRREVHTQMHSTALTAAFRIPENTSRHL
jgi:hypothetical protein